MSGFDDHLFSELEDDDLRMFRSAVPLLELFIIAENHKDVLSSALDPSLQSALEADCGAVTQS